MALSAIIRTGYEILVMKRIETLIEGYKHFHRKYFVEDKDLYERLLREGQSPIAAIIACSDSRVDPSIITAAQPGELFVIRNVANLVPPYQPGTSYHGTSSALEFAIHTLKIPHVIVFGHSQCAGIRALMEDAHEGGGSQSFIKSWMKIAQGVKEEVQRHHARDSIEWQAHLCERKAIEQSLNNLLSFPWIKEKVEAKTLHLHGWHFDLKEGALWEFAQTQREWRKLA